MSNVNKKIEDIPVKKKSSAYKGSAAQGQRMVADKEGAVARDGKKTSVSGTKNVNNHSKSATKEKAVSASKSATKDKTMDKSKSTTKKNSKPWEQMNKKKEQIKQPKETKKVVSEFKSFLYLVPKKISVSDMAKCLDFIPKSDIEVWTEEGVLEVTVDGSAITFEDMAESLDQADKKVLQSLGQCQAYACDYESTKAETVKRMTQIFLEKFGGKLGSDTEDFAPFITVEAI